MPANARSGQSQMAREQLAQVTSAPFRGRAGRPAPSSPPWECNNTTEKLKNGGAVSPVTAHHRA